MAWAALASFFWYWPPGPVERYQPPPPTWYATGSIVRTDDLHLGIRPAFDTGGSDASFGATLQLSVKTPW